MGKKNIKNKKGQKLLYISCPKCFLIKFKMSIFFLKIYRSIMRIEQKWPGSVFKREFGLYKKVDIEDKGKYDYRFCVVRDPVERFKSAFESRINFHKDLLVPRNLFLIRKNNLKAEPDLDYFLENFENYKKIPDIFRHFMTQTDCYGDDISFFTDIFSVRELSKVKYFLSNFFDCEMKLLNKQRTKSDKIELNRKQTDKIKEIYSKDYEVYGNYM
jgi:hypothetical protein